MSRKGAAPEDARATFERLKPSLMTEYADRYVVVLGDRVVDADADLTALAGRFFAAHPASSNVYFGFVGELPPFGAAAASIRDSAVTDSQGNQSPEGKSQGPTTGGAK